MVFNNKIKDYLTKRKFNFAPDETYAHINDWLEWYQNDVSKFHRYMFYNGQSMTQQSRYKLGMAKKVCEDWANLLLNERVQINAGTYTNRLEEILTANNFYTRANQLIEMVFALGTGAFVEYMGPDETIIIDYIRADMIYPLSWDNGDVTECAFGTHKVIASDEVIYLQIHRYGREDDGENPNVYYIENCYVNEKTGKEIDPPEDVEKIVNTGSELPLFQIVTPNICNNIDLDSPLGVSVYANALDQLKSCDLIYDSYSNEFVLGRKRIMVPVTQVKRQMQADGITAPVFDTSDTTFYMLPGNRESDFKLTEVDMHIRAQEHELGIQRAIDLISLKCGMGTGRYRFERSGAKTATEVVSEKSDLYQNKQKHIIILNAALTGMVEAIAYLDGSSVAEVVIDFDDSIIEDSEAERRQDIQDVSMGVMKLEEYRAKWYGESIEEARNNLPVQNAEVMM